MNEEILGQIEKLAELTKKGVLTEDEFQQKKSMLLDQVKAKSPKDHNSSAETQNNGTYALPIPSLILGIFTIFCFFDDSDWDADTIAGISVFAIAGLILGIISVSTQKKGQRMAIAGIVLSSLALLMLIGLTTEV